MYLNLAVSHTSQSLIEIPGAEVYEFKYLSHVYDPNKATSMDGIGTEILKNYALL